MSFDSNFKTVQFTIPVSLYDFFSDYINKTIKPKNPLTVDYLLRCLAINRAISNGILNEFGEPNYYVLPPELDLSELNISSGITSGNSDK